MQGRPHELATTKHTSWSVFIIVLAALADQVIVTAQYNLLMMTLTRDGGTGADADVDLSSSDQGLNVPVVLVSASPDRGPPDPTHPFRQRGVPRP